MVFRRCCTPWRAYCTYVACHISIFVSSMVYYFCQLSFQYYANTVLKASSGIRFIARFWSCIAETPQIPCRFLPSSSGHGADHRGELSAIGRAAAKENHSHIRYLEALLAMKGEERDRHAIGNRIRDAQLPRMKTLENFDFGQAPTSALGRTDPVALV
jgi:hypothetical protein